MIKKLICTITNHPQNVSSTEQAEGREFRFVNSCSCGKHVTKSIPLDDNDVLNNIDLSRLNFPVDTEVSTQ